MIAKLAKRGITYDGTRNERGAKLGAQLATGLRGSAAMESYTAEVRRQTEAGEKHLRERCFSACILEQIGKTLGIIPAECQARGSLSKHRMT